MAETRERRVMWLYWWLAVLCGTAGLVAAAIDRWVFVIPAVYGFYGFMSLVAVKWRFARDGGTGKQKERDDGKR